MRYPIIISIEGNIGAGKSSLLNKLRSSKLKKDCEFIDEPIKVWQEIKTEKNENILEMFYKDKKRWGYTFQNLTYLTRMDCQAEIIVKSDKKFIITDRSLDADKNVFGKMLYDDKLMNSLEWQTYRKWNKFFTKYFYPGKDKHIIYIDCTVDTSTKRIKKRARESERLIEKSYLEKLDKYHRDWLNSNDYNILTIDGDKDFIDDEKIYQKVEDEIIKFIEKI